MLVSRHTEVFGRARPLRCVNHTAPRTGIRVIPGSDRCVYAQHMMSSDFDAMKQVLVGPADDEIVRCETEMRAAQLNADVSALDRLIADELLFTGPDGQLGSKAEDLQLHGSGTVQFRSHEPEELRVRRLGADAAVSALKARLAVEIRGQL